METLDEAVRAGRQAVTDTPENHPERGARLNNLGWALQTLYGRTGQSEARAEARQCYQEAAGHQGATVEGRIQAYRQLAVLAEAGPNSTDHTGSTDHTAQALAAVESAVALLPQLTSRALTRGDREHQLGQIGSLAALAAAPAAQAATAAGASARLAQDAERVRLQSLSQARRTAQHQWEVLIQRIRALDGFTSFQLAPSVATLAAQSRNGPVVFLVAGPARCDALILTGDPDSPVSAIRLDALTEADAYTQAGRLLTAVHTAADPDVPLAVRKSTQADVHAVLAWLWDTTVEPVLTALGHTTAPHRARTGRACGGARPASSATCPCTPPATMPTSPTPPAASTRAPRSTAWSPPIPPPCALWPTLAPATPPAPAR